MNAILIGYKDAGGLTAPVTLRHFEDDIEETVALFDDARNLHKFPEGIKFLALYTFETPSDVANFISDDAAEHAQKSAAKRQAESKRLQELSQIERDADDNIKKSNKLVADAAVKRNKAIAAVAAQRNLIAAETVPAADKDKAMAKIEKDLQPAMDAAIAEFNKILGASNVLKSSKSTAEEKQKALVDLGLKK